MISSTFNITCDDINDKSIFINWSDEERVKLFSILLKKMSLTYFAEMINHDLPTLSEIKNGTVKPSTHVYFSILNVLNLNTDLRSLSISSRNSKPIKIINNYISPELLGLIHSDGFLVTRKKVVMCGFYNKNKTLTSRFIQLLNMSFKCIFYKEIDKRDGSFVIRLPAIIGRILIKKFDEKTSKSIIIPDLLKEEIPSYIRGKFDGDGTIYHYKNSKISIPTIRICTGDKLHAENLKNTLKRIDIYSRVCCERSRNSTFWNVVITRQRDVLRFIEKVGSNHPKKKRRMNKIKQFLNSKFK